MTKISFKFIRIAKIFSLLLEITFLFLNFITNARSTLYDLFLLTDIKLTIIPYNNLITNREIVNYLLL